MVDHYHNKADGLLCPLKVPCIAPGYQRRCFISYQLQSNVSSNFELGVKFMECLNFDFVKLFSDVIFQ